MDYAISRRSDDYSYMKCVAHLSNVFYVPHKTSRPDPNTANFTPVSEFRTTSMIVILMLENLELQRQYDLQRHDIHIKLHECTYVSGNWKGNRLKQSHDHRDK